MNKRTFFVIISIVLLIIEVIIALYIKDQFIRPYVGDVLVAILLYFIARIAFLNSVIILPLYIFFFATVTEILQYFDYVTVLGLGDIKFFRILLGSTFSIEDILCYGVGCIICWAFQWMEFRRELE